jgi:hypothetical protein
VVDAVCIVTPTSTHHSISLEVIAAGKHLFIEKPLTDHPSTSKDLAKRIYELVEQNMNRDMKTEARARGVSEESIILSDRIGKALGFDVMPLTPAACGVYDWVAEQEAKGEKIETFARWAKSEERIDYIRMYRKDAENIKIDWVKAFNKAVNARQTEFI